MGFCLHVNRGPWEMGTLHVTAAHWKRLQEPSQQKEVVKSLSPFTSEAGASEPLLGSSLGWRQPVKRGFYTACSWGGVESLGGSSFPLLGSMELGSHF